MASCFVWCEVMYVMVHIIKYMIPYTIYKYLHCWLIKFTMYTNVQRSLNSDAWTIPQHLCMYDNSCRSVNAVVLTADKIYTVCSGVTIQGTLSLFHICGDYLKLCCRADRAPVLANRATTWLPAYYDYHSNSYPQPYSRNLVKSWSGNV